MKQLEIRELLVKTKTKTILSVEQAAFDSGSIYGVVGPSGAGKSTFLRVINFLQKPSKGWIKYWGEELHLPSLTSGKSLPIQRQMAFVAQTPTMFQSTVFDNVALGLRYRGLEKQTIADRVMSALQLVGLEHAARQQAYSLSGGEAQRIALARAIVLEPRLLLLDEPTANLDPANVAIFEEVLSSIYHQTETTVIIVTHNLGQAKRLTDSCLFLHDGQVLETEQTEQFFSAPVNPKLQDFLSGRMIF